MVVVERYDLVSARLDELVRWSFLRGPETAGMAVVGQQGEVLATVT